LGCTPVQRSGMARRSNGGKLEGPGIFTSLRNMFENEENVIGMDVRPMRLVMEYIPKATVVAGIKTPGQ
jgi:hypothetical protein